MRHGQAADFDSLCFGETDSDRLLTQIGESEANTMANWLKNLGIEFDCIFVSPYKRAQQTSKIVAKVLKQQKAIKTIQFIRPEDSAEDFHDYIDGLNLTQPMHNVLIVSHMPLVSYLVTEFSSDHEMPIFQTAAVAELSYNTKTHVGHLVKLLAPDELKL
jgi:phosphohistidine phosphatase